MPSGRHSAKSLPPELKGFRRRWPRRLLIGTNVVVALVLAVSAGAYGYVQYQFSQIRKVHVLGLTLEGHGKQSQDTQATIAPFTMLIVGSDTRNFSGGSAFQGTGASTVTGQRSDSIILLRVVPASRSIALLSIPRDTIVPIPGLGTTRVNEAFNSGNAQLLVRVLAQDFGVEVNHFAEANFGTFQSIADAVGGVTVWFPAAARDGYSLLRVGPGCNNLSGSLALAFVRARHYEYYLNGSWHSQLLPESDLARIQRQQAFVKLALQKAKKIAPTNITELNSVVTSITNNLTLDSTFSNSELLSLVRIFRSAPLTNIPQFTYPTVNSTANPGGLDPVKTEGDKVVQQFLDVGQTPPAAGTAPPTTAPPTTTVTPASVPVEVANGSGVAGQATKAGKDLGGLGYPVTVSQAAYRPLQATTVVRYAPDAKAAATQIQGQLTGGATLQLDSTLTASPFAVEVVTGTSYAGVTGSAPTGSGSAGSTTTAPNVAIDGSATVTPESSSYVNGTYVPPGRTPGQAVVTCP